MSMEDIYKTDIFKKTEPTFLSNLKSLFTCFILSLSIGT